MSDPIIEIVVLGVVLLFAALCLAYTYRDICKGR